MIFNFNGSGGGNETIKYNADDDHNYYLVNGEWVKGEKVNLFWDGYLYNGGTINGDYAGEVSKNYATGSYSTFTKNANNIYLAQSSGNASINSGFEDKVDLTKYSKIILKGTTKVLNTGTQSYAEIGISSEAIGSTTIQKGCEKYATSASYASTSSVSFTHELDVSEVTGEKYVYFGLLSGTASNGAYAYMNVTEVYVE